MANGTRANPRFSKHFVSSRVESPMFLHDGGGTWINDHRGCPVDDGGDDSQWDEGGSCPISFPKRGIHRRGFIDIGTTGGVSLQPHRPDRQSADAARSGRIEGIFEADRIAGVPHSWQHQNQRQRANIGTLAEPVPQRGVGRLKTENAHSYPLLCEFRQRCCRRPFACGSNALSAA